MCGDLRGNFWWFTARSMQPKRVDNAQKTQIIDVDISKFFDNVKHDIMLRKIAQRINDGKVVNHHPI